jgi:hypothetical protein
MTDTRERPPPPTALAAAIGPPGRAASSAWAGSAAVWPRCSSCLGPARSGWRFKSIATYAHRRAWRILPPYWAALVFSLLMTWYVLAQPGWGNCGE